MPNDAQTKLPCWNLEPLVNAEGFDSHGSLLDAYRREVGAFEAHAARLSNTMPADAFLEILAGFERITRLGSRFTAYAQLLFSENTRSPEALELLAKTEETAAEMSNRLLFFSLWWKGLDGTAATRLLADAGEFRYFLETLRRFAPHTLSGPEEKVMSIKDVNGIHAMVSLYDVITNGFRFEIRVEGEHRVMSREEISVFVRHPDPKLRAAAYREMYGRVYRDNALVLETIYRHRVRDWTSEHVGLRHFPSSLSVRNLENDIPDAAVDLLLDVCRDNRGVFQAYFAWKANRLGMKRLRRYDLYAPPTAASQRRYGFDEALDLVLDAFHGFSPAFGELARRVIAERRIHAPVLPGKRSGAFCHGVFPGDTPYVLVNFTGTVRDVGTLAHELGHAVHALLAEDHPAPSFHAPLPLAETASVFSELLVTERLLASETDPAARIELLSARLDDAYATVMRQAYFTMFERKAHAAVTAAAAGTSLDGLYLENLREQFGEAVDVSEEFRCEWTSIPHIYHAPFYCYAYSFGQLLVLSLFRQFQNEGSDFVQRFRTILAAGGSRRPDAVLLDAGIDIAARSFWEGGFDILRGMIGELIT